MSSNPTSTPSIPSTPSTSTDSQTPAVCGSSQSPINVDNASQNTSTSEIEAEVISTRKLTSPAWQHFKKFNVKGELKARCNYCKKDLVGTSKAGTRHLLDHHKTCPRRRYADIRQQVLVNQQARLDNKMTLGNFHFDHDFSKKELANMIILHGYPLSLVEHFGFRRYSASLHPLFKVPSRNTIKKEIFKIFYYEKSQTMSLLERNKSRVAITTDMWTADHQKKGFMTVTMHFIDENWELHSRIMRFIYVPCPHTSENLSEALLDCLFEWNVDRKLSTITVDNCSTNDALIRILLEKLDTNTLILNGSLLHMRCCAHVLNLIVQDGLQVIGKSIERIRDSVAFWTGSEKREQKFLEAVKQLGISSTKKLQLDCKTRWNSTYSMLQVALIYKDVFARLSLRDSLYKTLPTSEDWELAREICVRLKLFYNVTEMFSGTKYPTANIYFPKVCEIKLSLSKWFICSNDVIRTMSLNMIDKFNKYWSVIHGIMGVAVVLDPRYKLKLLEYYFPLIYTDGVDVEIKRIQQLAYDLLGEYEKATHDSIDNVNTRSFSSSSSTLTCELEEHDPLDNFDLFASDSRSSIVKSELDNYLEEPLLPRNKDFDVLAWWKSSGLKYPILQKIARDILAIPISTVASESAFSTSGRLVTPHRSRLHSKTLEALMCGQSWIRTQIQATNTQDLDSSCLTTVDYDLDENEVHP